MDDDPATPTGISEPAASASVSATTAAASSLEALRLHAQASPSGFERAPLSGDELGLPEMSELSLGDEVEQHPAGAGVFAPSERSDM